MSCLCIFRKSPSQTKWETLLNWLSGEKSALLLEDGVYLLKPPALFKALFEKCEKIYALERDLEARGLSAPDGVEVLGFNEAIDLIRDEYDKIISW
jgi:sulfur relay protein TusB/DsrH